MRLFCYSIWGVVINFVIPLLFSVILIHAANNSRFEPCWSAITWRASSDCLFLEYVVFIIIFSSFPFYALSVVIRHLLLVWVLSPIHKKWPYVLFPLWAPLLLPSWLSSFDMLPVLFFLSCTRLRMRHAFMKWLYAWIIFRIFFEFAIIMIFKFFFTFVLNITTTTTTTTPTPTTPTTPAATLISLRLFPF